MSKGNANLLNSLMWNLREMTNLIKMIKNSVGDVKCSSWRHPLMSCGELDVPKLLEDSKDSDRYAYLLELTFDRLIYVLNLMVKYLENTNDLAKFRPSKNTERPINLSMASVLYMVWERIQEQNRFAKDRQTERGKGSHFKGSPTSSVHTQSDITAISACSSCEIAQNMVTQIVLKMENFFGEDSSASALLTQRNLMKEKIISSSNWSAMTSWVSAVLKDLSNICEEMQKFKLDNRRLKSRIDSGESTLAAKVRKQEEDMKMMQRVAKESEDKTRAMEKEIKYLKEERARMQESFGGQLSEMKSRNAELTKHLVELEATKKTAEDRSSKRDKSATEGGKEWKAKFEAELKKRESAQEETESLRLSLERVKADKEAQFAEVNSKYSNLQSKSEQLVEKIHVLKEENAKLATSLSDKQREIDTYSEKLLDAFPDISDSDKTIYKGTGDPLVDMRHQIEANKLRMNRLASHNESLMQTISKIEAMKK